MYPIPKIPWQVTGNHWVMLPCVHPADASLHAVSAISHAARGAIDIAGSPGFVDADGEPLLRLRLAADGAPVELATGRIAWQRVLDWLPTFNAVVGNVTVRGTVFAPHGRRVDLPGFVYALSVENRGDRRMSFTLTAEGAVGARQVRVRTARPLPDAHLAAADGDTVLVAGADPRSGIALAFGMDDARASAISSTAADDPARWALTRDYTIEAGERVEVAIYGAVALEPDGAAATLARMRRRGWRTLADDTHAALRTLQQSTGLAAVDRLVNRHLVFAYFGSAARAIDDARWYLMRTRVPWHDAGVTLRDWDALMWVVPAIQLADQELARELLVRTCELHGYAPGRGVNYIDGTPFESAFSVACAAAYPSAVDAYIAATGDDRVVEDMPVAEALYAAHDDIAAVRHPSLPLYATDAAPSGLDAALPFSLHANAIVAHALDILRQMLDEKSAEKVEAADVVRAAILRHFATDRDAARSTLVSETDLDATTSLDDDPVGSVLWVPQYGLLSREDSVYRRTARRVSAPAEPVALAHRVAQLLGPDGGDVLDWLRRAPLDGGFAAEFVDGEGNALGNGGDASLSALVAHTVWYAVSALGMAPR